MKGFKKDGKFRPTGTKPKSALKKSDLQKRNKKSTPASSTVFGGMGLFDMPNRIGKWEGQTGYRGMMDVWVHKKTGDAVIVEPFEDTPPERIKDPDTFEGEWEASLDDHLGNSDSLIIGSYEEALQKANDFMKENKDGWK